MKSTVTDKLRRGLGRRIRPLAVKERRAGAMLSICFDDFPKSAWTEGGRILRDHRIRATFYVAGGLCDTEFAGHRMFSRSDLEHVQSEGHEIGCHTFDHQSCLRRSSADLDRSMNANAAFVRESLGDVRMVSFTYPYGHAPVFAKVHTARRFAAARGVDAGLNSGTLDLAQLRSVGLERGTRTIGDIEPWIERAIRSQSWLIVHTHDVSERPGPFGCRPEDLDQLIRSAKTAGMEILTIKGALASRLFATAG